MNFDNQKVDYPGLDEDEYPELKECSACKWQMWIWGIGAFGCLILMMIDLEPFL